MLGGVMGAGNTVEKKSMVLALGKLIFKVETEG